MNPLNDKWIMNSDLEQIGIKHRKLSEEYLFYKAVADGNLGAIDKNLRANKFIEVEGVGKLSKNSLVNIKYHFVITTAMVTRYCSNYGIPLTHHDALSDAKAAGLIVSKFVHENRFSNLDQLVRFAGYPNYGVLGGSGFRKGRTR